MLIKKVLVAVTAIATAAVTLTSTAGTAQADTATPGTYNTIRPARVLDTRAGTGSTQIPLARGATLTFDADAGLSGPVGAVALTITAVRPTGGGWLTVFPTGVTRPLASTVNFVPGRTTVNSTLVPVGTDGRVSIYNGSTGSVDVLADLTGWWTAGEIDPTTAGAMTTLTPTRILDTRVSPGAPAAPRSTTKVPVLGRAGVPASGVSAVAVNLTVATPAAAGYLTAGSEAPQQGSELTSTLNFLAGQSRANMAVVPVNPDGTIAIYNGSVGSSQIIIDVLGYFSDGQPAADGTYVSTTVYRAADTRIAPEASPIPALSSRRIQLLPSDGSAAIFKALAVNITVARSQSSGFLTAWDGATTLPPTSNNNFRLGEDGASATIVPVNSDGTVTIYNGSFGNIDVIIDTSGFVLGDLLTARAPGATAARTGADRAAVIADAVASAKAFAARR